MTFNKKHNKSCRNKIRKFFERNNLFEISLKVLFFSIVIFTMSFFPSHELIDILGSVSLIGLLAILIPIAIAFLSDHKKNGNKLNQYIFSDFCFNIKKIITSFVLVIISLLVMSVLYTEHSQSKHYIHFGLTLSSILYCWQFYVILEMTKNTYYFINDKQNNLYYKFLEKLSADDERFQNAWSALWMLHSSDLGYGYFKNYIDLFLSKIQYPHTYYFFIGKIIDNFLGNMPYLEKETKVFIEFIFNCNKKIKDVNIVSRSSQWFFEEIFSYGVNNPCFTSLGLFFKFFKEFYNKQEDDKYLEEFTDLFFSSFASVFFFNRKFLDNLRLLPNYYFFQEENFNEKFYKCIFNTFFKDHSLPDRIITFFLLKFLTPQKNISSLFLQCLYLMLCSSMIFCDKLYLFECNINSSEPKNVANILIKYIEISSGKNKINLLTRIKEADDQLNDTRIVDNLIRTFSKEEVSNIKEVFSLLRNIK